jgi:outer membrane lipoprotein-sorting protein
MIRCESALVAVILLVPIASPMYGTPPAQGEAAPSLTQVLSGMRAHNAYQSQQLTHYEAIRHYKVQYKGFGTTISAEMTVEVNYNAAAGKQFRILSRSGSMFLCNKVLKRAVESEKEASRDQQLTALNRKNYRFRLIGTEQIDGRPAYVLHVKPLRGGKFLYRGTVWVDAEDYAVVKIEVQPAKNPSFWISRSEIENTNSETQGMWLPQKNRSESKIRIGGTAVLTIDYGVYHIALADNPQVNPVPAILKSRK